MLVDFHVHSTASDGTFSPSELIAKAKDFAVIALTDHDNCDGITEFCGGEGTPAPSSGGPGPRRVAGIELSIDPGKGFDKFHLLGLGIDPENVALKAFLKKVLDGRNGRNDRIFENFHRLGIDIHPEPHGDVLARPHFARWLVEHGYATDIPSAFQAYLLPDSPAETRCYEERFHPDQEEVFRVIHGAGGLCVMAHPKYWRRNWKDIGPDYAAAEKELARLKEVGLDGLEAIYQANTVEENLEFPKIAKRLGLLRSVGSDFHGANKPTIPLGMEVTEDYIRPLLERLG